jgi:hypothetical protein
MRMEASLPAPCADVACAAEGDPLGKDRKIVHNASSKVSLVVQRMLFPLLDTPMRTHVALDAEADQLELDLIDQVGRHKPGIMDDQQSFISHLQSLLERYKMRAGSQGTYARVPPFS